MQMLIDHVATIGYWKIGPVAGQSGVATSIEWAESHQTTFKARYFSVSAPHVTASEVTTTSITRRTSAIADLEETGAHQIISVNTWPRSKLLVTRGAASEESFDYNER